MKYKGRIISMAIFIIATIYFKYHVFLELGYLPFSEYVGSIAFGGVVWWLGKQYDQAQHYKAISESTIESLIHQEEKNLVTLETLKETNKELNLIYNNVTDGIFLIGHDGSILSMNKQYTSLLGWTMEDVRNSNVPKVIPKELQQEQQELLAKLKRGLTIPYHETQRLHKNGQTLNILASYQPVQEKDTLAIAIYKDITKEKQMQRELDQSIQKYQSLFEYNYDAVYSLDLEGNYLSCNPTCEKLTGYTHSEFLKISFNSIITVEDLQKTFYHFEEAKKGKPQTYECTIITKGRKKLICNVINIPMYVDGEITGVFGIAKDITEQKRKEEQIHYMAYYDQLTGLANRTLFEDRLKQAWKTSKKEKTLLGLMYLDLDGFKLVNDSLGHSIGDQLLVEASKRIEACLSEDQTLARMGGDEFTILVPQLNNSDELIELAKKILELFTKAFQFEDINFHIGVSLGLTYYQGEKEVNSDMLIRQADIAMYETKENGKNSYNIYTKIMDKQPLKRAILENDFREALKNEDFILEYQPIVEIQTGKIVGAEALVRWNHPTLGRISPDEFIPLAEESGLIIPLGHWILRTACKQAKIWQLSGLKPIKVSVNVSVNQLRKKEMFLTELKHILLETKLEAEWLELEVTETVIMKNEDKIAEVLNEIKEMGISIAIDDFGTGYSSMIHLKNFAINTLKIDRSFISEMTLHDKSRAIASSIIKLAKALDLNTIAEGVESKDQLLKLSEEKCNNFQGYYFSPSVPERKFEDLLKNDRASLVKLFSKK